MREHLTVDDFDFLVYENGVMAGLTPILTTQSFEEWFPESFNDDEQDEQVEE